ncbi:cation:proton antiporter [Hydrogenothermus marinus]|uniref:Transporter (CPA2 family) n=1 Tax=Hydrogenothermus marinus TaxID=133270 RepID=A0A3M0C3N9_9AQUI|nr:cation:proton antiporter [Hydrogenothermus marinus]RMA97582.1 transporter (CPA2 family) [Hydrogenothermus marinus]
MNNVEAILILIVVIGAFFMPIISRRLNLPSPVAEIIFGLFMGLGFKDIIHQTDILNFLGELGFIILMYLAGLEIKFETLKKLPTKEILLYISVIILVILISFLVIYTLNLAYIYLLVLMIIAVGLLFPVLKDAELTSSNLGQSVLIIASIGEVVSLVAISLFFLIAEFGFSEQTLFRLFEISLFFLAVYYLLKIFKLIIWWYPEKFVFLFENDDITETAVRYNFVNMFIFVSLAALLGLEPIIGAFFGGLLLGIIVKEKEKIIEKLSAFGYGFLIPIFFIDVGLKFNLLELLKLDIIYNAFILSILMLVVRFMASIILYFSKFSFKEILIIPFALSMPLTLLVAVATLGYETHLINQKEASSILLTAIISGLIFPWIFKNLVKRLNFIQK